jgi:hypothetical protein
MTSAWPTQVVRLLTGVSRSQKFIMGRSSRIPALGGYFLRYARCILFIPADLPGCAGQQLFLERILAARGRFLLGSALKDRYFLCQATGAVIEGCVIEHRSCTWISERPAYSTE